MSLFRTWWLYAAGLVLATGCVGSDDPAVVGPKYPDESSFCQALAEVACSAEVVEGCYGANNTDNAASCRSAFRVEGCNPNHYGYHHEGAEACIAKVKAIYADGALTQLELDDTEAVCAKALSNSGGVSSPCTVDAECNVSDGLSCVVKPGQPGTCQAAEEVEGGFACTAPHQTCVDGFLCINGNCLAGQQLDQPCTETEPCAAELFCEPTPPSTTDGRCVAKLADGQACTSDERCESGFCQSTCRANLRLVDAESCAAFLPG